MRSLRCDASPSGAFVCLRLRVLVSLLARALETGVCMSVCLFVLAPQIDVVLSGLSVRNCNPAFMRHADARCAMFAHNCVHSWGCVLTLPVIAATQRILWKCAWTCTRTFAISSAAVVRARRNACDQIQLGARRHLAMELALGSHGIVDFPVCRDRPFPSYPFSRNAWRLCMERIRSRKQCTFF